jgi:hypothetical protein
LKSVTENGWDDTAIRGQRAYASGDFETALVLFGLGAEAGDVNSQLNFAYIADALTESQQDSIKAFADLPSTTLRYWTLAAGQVSIISTRLHQGIRRCKGQAC